MAMERVFLDVEFQTSVVFLLDLEFQTSVVPDPLPQFMQFLQLDTETADEVAVISACHRPLPQE